MLEEISIHNYKSIRNVTLKKLPSFAVFVGANASGKTNFVDSLDFLALIFKSGLSSAISAKGGYQNIVYRRGKPARGGISFHIKVSITDGRKRRTKERIKYDFIYDFKIISKGESIRSQYLVKSEYVKITRHYPDGDKCLLEVVRNDGKIKIPIYELPLLQQMKPIWAPSTKYVTDFYSKRSFPEDQLIATSKIFFLQPLELLSEYLSKCGVYQISPYIARGTGIPARSAELGRFGENLPAVIDYLNQNEKESFEELLEHLQHTVPTMENLQADYVESKQLGLFFKEKDVKQRWFSVDVSDGTIQTVSVFVPLVDNRKNIVFIEEPENSLHPWILRHFIDSCKKHSIDKQIFLTTQSVIAVNETPISSLYIVRRVRGETSITRCLDLNPEIKEVIQQQLMGLGEYWDSGAVSGIPMHGEQLELLKNEESS